VVLLVTVDGPLLVLDLSLAELALLNFIEHLCKSPGVEIGRCMEVHRNHRLDIVIGDLRMPSFVGDDQPLRHLIVVAGS
jgi:hypothetical protein